MLDLGAAARGALAAPATLAFGRATRPNWRRAVGHGHEPLTAPGDDVGRRRRQGFPAADTS